MSEWMDEFGSERFVTKPLPVQVIKDWTGVVPRWFRDETVFQEVLGGHNLVFNDGCVFVTAGDVVVRDSQGRYSAHSPEEFARLYEKPMGRREADV